MFAALIKLLPALRFPELGVLDGENEQLAIESCVSAVQMYFPCDSGTSYTNHTCLCEQYLWSAACYDSHASDPTSHPDYFMAETRWSDYCRAAGSMGDELVQQKHHLQRRQIGSFLSSIGGKITSFLTGQTTEVAQPSDPPSPTPPPPTTTKKNDPPSSTPPPPRSRPSTLATMTSPSASQSPSKSATPSSKSSSSSTTSDSSTLTSSESSTSSSTPSTTPSPSSSPSSTPVPKSSGPSTGAIAGAVIGSLAALSLLIMGTIFLISRLKSKKQQESQIKPFPRDSTDSEHGMVQTNAAAAAAAATTTTADAQTPTSYAPSPIAGKPLPPAPSAAAGMNEKGVFRHEYAESSAPSGLEMSTNANVWELDSKECAAPVELDAGPVIVSKKDETSVQVRSVSGQSSNVIPRKPVGAGEKEVETEAEAEKGKKNKNDELFLDS